MNATKGNNSSSKISMKYLPKYLNRITPSLSPRELTTNRTSFKGLPEIHSNRMRTNKKNPLYLSVQEPP